MKFYIIVMMKGILNIIGLRRFDIYKNKKIKKKRKENFDS